MEIKALEDVFINEISELYDAERQILKALPKMATAASHSELTSAFELHEKQTKRHVERLEKVFKALGQEAASRESGPIQEIIRQGDELIAMKQAESAVLDAALITVAQKVEHYEIATYGSACSHARMLGYSKIARALHDTLNEEEETDALLTQLATKSINVHASKAPYASARVAPRGGEESNGFGIGALIAGAAIGAGIALLYAPKSGDQVRQDLKKSADDWRAKGEELRSSAQDLIDRGREKVQSTLG